jgi:hypothetical protein
MLKPWFDLKGTKKFGTNIPLLIGGLLSGWLDKINFGITTKKTKTGFSPCLFLIREFLTPGRMVLFDGTVWNQFPPGKN